MAICNACSTNQGVVVELPSAACPSFVSSGILVLGYQGIRCTCEGADLLAPGPRLVDQCSSHTHQHHLLMIHFFRGAPRKLYQTVGNDQTSEKGIEIHLINYNCKRRRTST